MNIQETRKERGLTQEELSRLLNITRSTLAMWETGKSFPRSDKLPELANILGCSIDELFDVKEKSNA